MRYAGIILLFAAILGGCAPWHPPEAVEVVPPHAAAPQYSAPVPAEMGPMIMMESPPPGAVIEGPVPAPTEGPTLMAPDGSPLSAPISQWPPGTAVSPEMGLPAGPEVVSGLPNPLSVTVLNDEAAWDEITDVVDDYFRIASEQRPGRAEEVWTEGRIDTVPESGATILEPHRLDSVGPFNRWESTLQTIRRWAVVRVTPQPDNYLVEVIVHKELEDLPHPEGATAGAVTFRTDGSLRSRLIKDVSRTHLSPRWLSLGRDTALEQQMLLDIQCRLTGVPAGAQPAWPP